jgi:hypothetical protein
MRTPPAAFDRDRRCAMRRHAARPRPRTTIGGFAVLGLVLTAAGCGGDAEPVAGSYRGSGEDGFTIEFVVTDDLTVPAASYSYTLSAACSDTILSGEVTNEGESTFDPALALDGSTLRIPRGGEDFAEARFEGDGSSVSGTWTAGGCSGDWQAERVGDVPEGLNWTGSDPTITEVA